MTPDRLFFQSLLAKRQASQLPGVARQSELDMRALELQHLKFSRTTINNVCSDLQLVEGCKVAGVQFSSGRHPVVLLDHLKEDVLEVLLDPTLLRLGVAARFVRGGVQFTLLGVVKKQTQ